MVEGKVEALEYRVIIFWKGDFTNSYEITNILSHSSQEGVKLENNTLGLDIKLVHNNGTHQFVNPDGTLKFSAKDVIRVYVKYKDGTPIDVNSRIDVLKEYFLKSWNINPQSLKVSLTCMDINYRIYNRLWSGNWRARDNGTATSIVGTTLTDTTKTWTVNNFVNRTVELEDGAGKIYPYLILSNTSTTLTLHQTVATGLLNTYKLGDSAPYVLENALQRVTNVADYTGNYLLSITRTTNYGTNYVSGIQFLRPDGTAFPVIDYQQDSKPYYTLIEELSAVNAINTSYEINNQTYLMNRDMIFSVSWDTEINKYRIDWFWSGHPLKLDSGVLTNVTNTVIEDTSKTWTVNIYKNKMIRAKGRGYNILSNTATTLTLSSNVTNLFNIGDSYIIYDSVDFIWDSENDFKNILNLQLGNDSSSAFNHILYSCGKNELTGFEIIGHSYKNDNVDAELNETYLPYTWITKQVANDNNLINNGTWTYPTYPYTLTNKQGIALNGAIVVNNNTEFTNNFKTVCQNIADGINQGIFKRVRDGILKGSMMIRGNNFFKAGTIESIRKYYNKGSSIMFKDPVNGFVNPLQVNGYYILKIENITHAIDSTRWTTNLTVTYDFYTQAEGQNSLL